MTLRSKTLLLVVLAVCALIAGLNLVTRGVVLSGFQSAEHAGMAEKVKATRSIVYTMAEEFSQRGLDWSDWNDMAEFLVDGNAAFVESNVAMDSMLATGWHVLMVVAADGSERVAVRTGQEHLEPVPAEFRVHLPRLMQGAADYAEPIVGIVMVGRDPYLVASMPIRKTDRSHGELAGRFITARHIDAAWIERLQRFTFLKIDLSPWATSSHEGLQGLDAVHVAARDAQNIVGTTPLTDIYGRPVLLMRVVRDRAMKVHGDRILHSSTWAVVAGGALLLVIAMTALGSGVLRPLSRLLAGVRQLESGQAAQVRVTSKDEFGELGAAFNRMASVIVEREQAQREANARTRLVLDAMGDALLTCGLDGELDPDASAAAVTWFGPPSGKVWDYLFPGDRNEATRIGLQSDLEQVQSDFLPFEMLAEQMPKRFERKGRSFGIEYRRVTWGDEDTRLLLIVRDVTAQTEAERAARETREMQAVVAQIVRDPDEFDRFLHESATLLDRLQHGTPLDQRKRDLHTLKGSTGLVGFFAFAEACHALEDEIAEDPARLSSERVAALRAVWEGSLQRIAAFIARDRDGQITLSARDHQRFLHLLEARAEYDKLASVAKAWTFTATANLFGRLDHQVARLGEQLEKEVRFELQHNDLRVRSRPMAEFLGSLAHVVRNAIDHGIEAPDVRLAQGKPAAGTLTLRTAIEGASFVLSLADDGAGIDWERVAQSARSKGLPHQTQAELLDAIFHDGFSTRDAVSGTSGRGVGLSAVRAACLELGGNLEVRSQLGQGTTFLFRFPLASPDNTSVGVVAWAPIRSGLTVRPVGQAIA